MNAHERAEYLFKQAEKLGLDAPTESMVADAINDAQCDALNFPHLTGALGRDSDFICSVKAACGRLAEDLAHDMNHRNKDHSKWYKAVLRVRKELQLEV